MQLTMCHFELWALNKNVSSLIQLRVLIEGKKNDSKTICLQGASVNAQDLKHGIFTGFFIEQEITMHYNKDYRAKPFFVTI